MADLAPGRKSLTERYGVEQPSAALERIIREHVDEATAQQILDDLRAASAKYQRASRVERARTLVSLYPDEQPSSKRAQQAVERARVLLANADVYIAEGAF